ncbi:MAG: hypothetical protein EPO39_07510 [Candidatus Manganitrophaceae bacterium]|nr:MAG: hypothetical protein EPO39_07510 [Candidatus Manganitrophaceae bacterium]
MTQSRGGELLCRPATGGFLFKRIFIQKDSAVRKKEVGGLIYGSLGGLQEMAAMKRTKIHAATSTKFPIEASPPVGWPTDSSSFSITHMVRHINHKTMNCTPFFISGYNDTCNGFSFIIE